MEQPGFFAILPANVRYDNRLKAQEKILYAEITALAGVPGYCYATNSYFEQLYDAKTRAVQGWLKHLQELEYIQIQVVYGVDGCPGGQRRITPLTTRPADVSPAEICGGRKNMRGTPAKICASPPQKNAPRIIQDINNTRDNNACAGAGARVEPKTVDDVFTAFASGSRGLLDAALDFAKFRAGGKHPLTVLGAERACATLRRLATESRAQNAAAYMAACINQSIERGWEGLFAVKDYTDPPPETAPAGTPPAPVRNIAPGEDITKYL